MLDEDFQVTSNIIILTLKSALRLPGPSF